MITDSFTGFRSYLKRSKVSIGVGWWHAHALVLWWRWSRSVGGSSGTRIVLGASPREADTGVSDGVTLHLVDGHLSGVALDELDEATALSGWDLDVGDLPEALEERAELVLGDVAGKATDKDGGVVGVSELVHWLRGTVVADRGSSHGVHARGHVASHWGARHTAHGTRWSTTARLVLGGCGGDSHGAVTAVNTLHLGESALLVSLIGEADEAVATRHAGDRISHDLGRLARWESGLEERDQNIFVDLWAKVTNEDRELRATVITRTKSAKVLR